MSSKRRRDRCKYHIIGQYYKNGEMINFCIAEDISEDADGKIFYQNCPMCGIKITEKIKTYQMNNMSQDKVIKEERIENKRKARTKIKPKCRIPKRTRICRKKK